MDDKYISVNSAARDLGLGGSLHMLEQLAKEDYTQFAAVVVALHKASSRKELAQKLATILEKSLSLLGDGSGAKQIAHLYLDVINTEKDRTRVLYDVMGLCRKVHEIHAGDVPFGDDPVKEIELRLARYVSQELFHSELGDVPPIGVQESLFWFFLYLEVEEEPSHEDKKDPVRSQFREWAYKAVALFDEDLVLRYREQVRALPAFEVINGALVKRWGASNVVDIVLAHRSTT